jgi:hypothetical protein
LIEQADAVELTIIYRLGQNADPDSFAVQRDEVVTKGTPPLRRY